MAQQTIVTLTDDIDGSEATETVSFGLDGRICEIDLNEAHAEDLREVGAWATANGLEVNSRGRLRAEIVEQYRVAGN